MLFVAVMPLFPKTPLVAAAILLPLATVNAATHTGQFKQLLCRPTLSRYMTQWEVSRPAITDTLSQWVRASDTILASPKAFIELDRIPVPMENVLRFGGPLKLSAIEKTAHFERFQKLGIPPHPFVPRKAIVIDKSDQTYLGTDPSQWDKKASRFAQKEEYREGAALLNSLRTGFLGYRVAYEDSVVVVLIQHSQVGTQ
jgi:hypothetical protein